MEEAASEMTTSDSKKKQNINNLGNHGSAHELSHNGRAFNSPIEAGKNLPLEALVHRGGCGSSFTNEQGRSGYELSCKRCKVAIEEKAIKNEKSTHYVKSAFNCAIVP